MRIVRGVRFALNAALTGVITVFGLSGNVAPITKPNSGLFSNSTSTNVAFCGTEVPLRCFGAVGDGVANDTVPIQAALTWAKTQGNVLLVAEWGAVYRITAMLDAEDCVGVMMGGRAGTGANSAAFRFEQAGAGLAISFKSSYSCGLQSCSVLFSNVAYTGGGVSFEHGLSGSDSGFPKLEDVGFYGVGPLNLHTCVTATPVINMTVRRCAFSRCGIGIAGGLGPVTIDNCIFTNCQIEPISGTGQTWRIVGSTFEPCTEGAVGQSRALVGVGIFGVEWSGNWCGDSTAASAGHWLDLDTSQGIDIGGGSHFQVDVAAADPAAIVLKGCEAVSVRNCVFLSLNAVHWTGGTSIALSDGPNYFTGTQFYTGTPPVGLESFDAIGYYLQRGNLAINNQNLGLNNGANNDISTTLGQFCVSAVTADFSISGFSRHRDGQFLFIVNQQPYEMTITHLAGSAAGNQIACPFAHDLKLPAPVAGSQVAVLLNYDAVGLVWRVIGYYGAPAALEIPAMGAAQAVDLGSYPIINGVLTANCVLTVTPPTVPGSGFWSITQGAGPFTFSVAGATCEGGIPPVPSVGAGDRDVYAWTFDGTNLTYSPFAMAAA
jgi:hypothetical protein